MEEAAVALGLSRAFACDAVRRGEILATKIGRWGSEVRARTSTGEPDPYVELTGAHSPQRRIAAPEGRVRGYVTPEQ